MNRNTTINLTGATSNLSPKFEVISDSEFWNEIGQDYDKGIQEFADRYNLETSSVLALAIVESQNEDPFFRILLKSQNNSNFPVYRFSFPKFIKHLWERKLQVLLSIGLPLLITGLIIDVSIKHHRFSSTGRIIVQRPDGLLAYQKITSNDIRFSIQPPPTSSASQMPVELNTAEMQVGGRYVLSTVPVDSILTENKLLSSELTPQMSNRLILSIPIKTDRLNSAVSPNAKVGLLFSKTQAPFELSTVVRDVILLGIEKHENSAMLIVAITQEQLEAIQKLLGNSEIFVIQN